MHSSATLSSITALVLLAGCVDHDASSFFVSGHVKPDDECFLEPGNPLVSRGVFNVEAAFGYFVFPLYNNQLRNRGSDAPLRADPNGILITSAEVELRGAAGLPIAFGAPPNPFTVPTSNYVPSTENANTPAQAVGNILVIPPAYADVLFQQLGGDEASPDAASVVIASIRVFGETTGGVDVESDEWLWPIDICLGSCLFLCVPADAAPTEPCCTVGQDFGCPVLDTSAVCM
jgi:hypothetical protein